MSDIGTCDQCGADNAPFGLEFGKRHLCSDCWREAGHHIPRRSWFTPYCHKGACVSARDKIDAGNCCRCNAARGVDPAFCDPCAARMLEVKVAA